MSWGQRKPPCAIYDPENVFPMEKEPLHKNSIADSWTSQVEGDEASYKFGHCPSWTLPIVLGILWAKHKTVWTDTSLNLLLIKVSLVYEQINGQGITKIVKTFQKSYSPVTIKTRWYEFVVETWQTFSNNFSHSNSSLNRLDFSPPTVREICKIVIKFASNQAQLFRIMLSVTR